MRAFRVYPEHRSLFWRVRVFPTRTAMRKAHAAARREVNTAKSYDGSKVPPGSGRIDGAVISITWTHVFKDGHRRVDPCLGTIFLAKDRIGGGVVSHEAAHAARYYFSRLGIDIGPKAMDERHAYAVGEIVRQIGARLW